MTVGRSYRKVDQQDLGLVEDKLMLHAHKPVVGRLLDFILHTGCRLWHTS